MNIISCVKVVPEEQDIVINGDNTLNIEKAASKISLYDLNAIEAAANIVADGDKVVALSVGGARLENSKVQKDILSRGADELTIVSDASLEGALPDVTSAVLAAAARTVGFDLILCGEGSSDLYAQICGVLTAERLNIPSVNCVSKITRGNGSVTVERALDSEIEEIEVPLPAVICLTSDVNTPRIPNMKAILQAGKKPVNKLDLASLGVTVQGASAMVSILAPQQKDRLKNIIEGDDEDSIAAFAENLRKALN